MQVHFADQSILATNLPASPEVQLPEATEPAGRWLTRGPHSTAGAGPLQTESLDASTLVSNSHIRLSNQIWAKAVRTTLSTHHLKTFLVGGCWLVAGGWRGARGVVILSISPTRLLPSTDSSRK